MGEGRFDRGAKEAERPRHQGERTDERTYGDGLVRGHQRLLHGNSETPESARAEVDKLTGQTNAEALTVLSNDTLRHFDVRPGRPHLWFSTLPGINGVLGEVASSEFDMG